MTKEEMKKILSEQEDKIASLENDLEYYTEYYGRYESALCDYEKLQEQIKENGIINIENFILKMKLENLYSEEIEKFINNYIRYCNN